VEAARDEWHNSYGVMLQPVDVILKIARAISAQGTGMSESFNFETV